MPPNHFGNNPLDYIIDLEGPFRLSHLSQKNHLKQQVA
jgi:hypothetical protein